MAQKNTKTTRRKRPEKIAQFLKDKGLPLDWPLSPHLATNRWYATIRGVRYYYGPLDGNPDEALDLFNHEAPYLKRDRTPPIRPKDGIKLHEILNPWLERQETRLKRGKIKPSTFADYRSVATFLAGVVGRATPLVSMTPDTWQDVRDAIDDRTTSPSVASRYVVIVRQAFRWASENRLIDAVPHYGPEFVVASKASKRAARHARGRQTFTAAELRAIIDDPQTPDLILAATLLCCNFGMTGIDVSDLRRRDIKLDDGTIDTLRGKTQAVRRGPLWDETAEAIKPFLKGKRPDHRLFIHDDDMPLIYWTEHETPQRRDRLQRRFTNAMKRHGIKLDRAGIGHIKHTFKGVVSAINDPVAVDTVVGHEPGKGIDEHYIRTIDPSRLQAVVDSMHDWLWPENEG